MGNTDRRYKYTIEYLLARDDGGKNKRSREVEFTKPMSEWRRKDYEKLEVYLERMEKTKCDVTVTNIEWMAN